MDFDLEMELEDAGIDAFEFSLMDDEERYEKLTDAGLDPDDYDSIELDSAFDAWSRLQDSGFTLNELKYMDEDEKREALEDAGLDPDDYDSAPCCTPVYYIPTSAETVDSPASTERMNCDCEVKLHDSDISVKNQPNRKNWWWIGAAVLVLLAVCAACVIPTVYRNNKKSTFEAIRRDFLSNAERAYPGYFEAALKESPYAEYVLRMDVSLDSSFERPFNYDFYEIEDEFNIRIYITDEFNTWLDQDKHLLLGNLDGVAGRAVTNMCRDRFREYTAYNYMDLRNLYGETVFPGQTSDVILYAGSNSYEYAHNVSGQYFVMNGRDHWYELVPSEAEMEAFRHMLPYVGMPTEYIKYTMVGEPDETDFVPEKKGMHGAYNAYIWRADNGIDQPLQVRANGGKVIEVIKYWEGLYWTADGMPNFSATAADKAQYYKDRNLDFSRIGKYDDYDVDEYDDPEDFWYDHADEFDSYEDAWDYWEDNR